MPGDELRRAANHLRARRYGEALSLLVSFLQRNPRSGNAWLLLSYALADSARKIEAVERALAINPANTYASQRLAELKSPRASQPPQSPSEIVRHPAGAGQPAEGGPPPMIGRPPSAAEELRPPRQPLRPPAPPLARQEAAPAERPLLAGAKQPP